LPRRRLKRPSKIVQNPRSSVDRELSKLDLAHEPKKKRNFLFRNY